VSSRLCVRGRYCATERRSTVSTETRSTAVASICALMVSRSSQTVRLECRGQRALDNATGLNTLIAIFDFCSGMIHQHLAYDTQ